MRVRIHYLLLSVLIGLLFACSDSKQALDTWKHADTGSYGATISPNGKYLMTGAIGGYGRVWISQKMR